MRRTEADKVAIIAMARKHREEKERAEIITSVDLDFEPESESETLSEGIYAEYQFPSPSNIEPYLKKFRLASKEQLLRSLKKKEKDKTTGDTPYSSSRLDYCAINILLNELGIIAPAFRPFRTLAGNKLSKANDVLLSRDRMVLDLHYLHCQYHDDFLPTDMEFKALATDDEFDFKLASQFALKKWTAEVKANSLGLSNKQMHELAVYKTKDIYDRESMIKDKQLISTVRRRLKQQADLMASRFDKRDVEQRIEEFICLRYARGSLSHAVDFWERRGNLLLDKPNARRNLTAVMGKRKRWFEKDLNIKCD